MTNYQNTIIDTLNGISSVIHTRCILLYCNGKITRKNTIIRSTWHTQLNISQLNIIHGCRTMEDCNTLLIFVEFILWIYTRLMNIKLLIAIVLINYMYDIVWFGFNLFCACGVLLIIKNFNNGSNILISK